MCIENKNNIKSQIGVTYHVSSIFRDFEIL
jgi:hypothetical protein